MEKTATADTQCLYHMSAERTALVMHSRRPQRYKGRFVVEFLHHTSQNTDSTTQIPSYTRSNDLAYTAFNS